MRFFFILLASILFVNIGSAKPFRKPVSCFSSTDADYFIPGGKSYSDYEITEDIFTWHFGFTVCAFEWGGECQKPLDVVSAVIDKATCKIISLECTIEQHGAIERCEDSYTSPGQR